MATRTQAEIDTLLNQKRLASRPSYFNADSGSESVILNETEDSLILASPESKQKAVEYLKLLLDAGSSSSDFDDLQAEYLAQQKKNAAAQKNELDTILTKFGTFKNEFVRTDESDAVVSGMAPILKALNKGFKSLSARQRTTDYNVDFLASAGAFFDFDLTTSEKRELRSWVRAILSYI